ncbi:MFS transporter [Oceanicola sp. S124]|uniref:MFS transporter n=1 Tax=Oceanicola sp. S124 TaxID=1042378 RepID=UPI000255863C|nr:MFS transporter [Oceanicola sp. S124]
MADTTAAQPAQPAEVTHPPLRIATFLFAGALIATSQSLGQGFLLANSQNIAGEIGATQTQAIWLTVAYMAPRASLPILLMKIRTQYGLRRFAEVGILAYVVATLLGFFISDLHSAIAVELVSGIAAAPLASLAFLYMLETLPMKHKLSVGLCGALTLIMLGSTLARVISPPLWDLGGWQALKLFDLGLILLALPFILYLPLTHQPRQKVISGADLVSYALIAAGFAGITAVFTWGAVVWWTDTPWIGTVLAGSLGLLTLAGVIELQREAPLLDIRWLASPQILHLTAVLLLFRIVLSEQSAGAPGLFQALGMGAWQMQGLFAVITLASIAGGVFCAMTISPKSVPLIHALALALVLAGALMDSRSTVLTRPEQLYLSQGMIAFAGAIFLPSAMGVGLMLALQKGPQYLLSFVIVFLSTQSLGGVIGSGLFRSFIRLRSAHHAAVLKEQLLAGDPGVTGLIASLAQRLSAMTTDATAMKAGAVQMIGTELSSQATVLAYNDAFLLLAAIAGAALTLLLLHLAWLIRSRAKDAQAAPAQA